MGRPIKDIDFKALDKLCEFQCTEIEAAGFFGVSVDTLERRVIEKTTLTFADYFKQKRGSGKASLRRRQWQKAMTGNPTMLIWLGKQYLDQKDKNELTGKDGGPLTVVFAKELQGV
jgi:RNA binding exosome subunit